MKRQMWISAAVSAFVMVTAAQGVAVAASADFDADFAAFEKARQQNKSAASAGNEIAETAPAAEAATDAAADPAPTAAAAAEVPPAPAAVEDPLAAFRSMQAANPLGAASNLPVGAPMPATANALDANPEELRAQMEMEAEAEKQRFKEESFRTALQQLLPLEPEQIRRVLEAFKESREESETPIAEPEIKTVVETVSLDPSAPTPVIKTSPGNVTTISILDQTGAPWAIEDISWAGKYEVTTPQEGGHVLRITPMTAHGMGNLSVRLVDLITPVIFTLKTGLDEVHYRFDARIPRKGPLAKTPIIEYGGLKAVAGTDANIVSVLEGTAGGNGVKLAMEGVDGRTTAWRIDGQMYLRTPLTLLSPAWDSSASSGDGMNVYTLSETPVIILSDRGQMVKARVIQE